jgi:hypothetical protein
MFLHCTHFTTADSRAMVEATSNFSFLDRWRIHLRTMRQDMVARAVQLKSNKSQEHVLPEFEKTENDDIIKGLYEARLEDRKKSAWRRKWNRRFKYMVTGKCAVCCAVFFTPNGGVMSCLGLSSAGPTDDFVDIATFRLAVHCYAL